MLKQFWLLSLILISALTGGTVVAQSVPAISYRTADPTLGSVAPLDYMLSAKDVILIKIFDEPQLDTRAVISEDGKIAMPLLGAVQVGGKKVAEAVKLIQELLDKDYIVNPQVTILVIESNRQQFTVLGQVQRPGMYQMPLDQPMTLLGAIALAGGYTRYASTSKVSVRRTVKGELKVIKLKDETAANSKGKPFKIEPDDVIVVGEKLL